MAAARLRPFASTATTFAAAMTAMYISMRLALPRPWWVLMTVYVTTQPLAGVMRPKMAYRLLGVLAGAAVAVIATDLFINEPLLLSAALALWVGTCLYLAARDRTPRTFAYMLAGYTAAIVGFPYIDQSRDIVQIAIARVEEMSLAIACAIAFHTVFLPWSPARALTRRLPRFLADARVWFVDAFDGGHAFRAEQERRRFAGDIAELSIIAIHLPRKALGLGASRRFVAALQDRMSVLLPLASAAEDRLRALRERDALTAPLAALVQDIRAWLATPAPTRHRAIELQARCYALAPKLGAEADWNALLSASLCQRLADFIEAYVDSDELSRHVSDGAGEGAATPHLRKLARRRASRRLQLDPGLALLSGAAGAFAIFAYCAFWITASWPEGAATAAFAAMVTCSFASQDDPAPAIVKYLGFTLAALPVSALYLFVTLPVTDGFTALAIALAPVLLVMGYIQSDPARAPYALPMLACFIVAMGFLDRFTADYARFLNVALAQIGGVVATIGTARLFRSVGAGWTTRRLLRQGWREVAALARDSRGADEIGWSQHMLDRLGQIAARMALQRSGSAPTETDALRDLRTGRNVIHLRRARRIVAEPALGQRLDQVLAQIAGFYTARARRRAPLAPPPTLLEAIDGALAHLHAAPAGETRRQGFLALTALRRNLFPHAQGYAGPQAA